MKKVSLTTIANKLNVSVVTVHKALKNQHGVSADLREKILSTAAELGYTPPSPDSLEYNFLFIIDKKFILSPNEQFYSEIYNTLNIECVRFNSKVHLIVHDNIELTQLAIKNEISKNKINGFFVSGEIDKNVLDFIDTLKLPTVCIDFFSSDYDFDYIYVDNYYAGYLVTKYLIKNGHKKIGFIGNIHATSSIMDRYFGYLRALTKYSLEIDNNLLINHNIETDNHSIDFNNLPTAYICHCDRAASFLYTQSRKKNIKIYDDLSVVSFDNTDLAEHLSPKLTSYGVEKCKYSTQALKTMIARIKKNAVLYNYTKLNLEIFERESVRNINF